MRFLAVFKMLNNLDFTGFFDIPVINKNVFLPFNTFLIFRWLKNFLKILKKLLTNTNNRYIILTVIKLITEMKKKTLDRLSNICYNKSTKAKQK